MTDRPVQGEPSDLAQLLDQVERRNSVLVRLAAGVERLSTEVKQLRAEIDDRPTKYAVAHRRRLGVALMLLYGVLIIWAHDVHVEKCSPGSQANAVVQWVTEHPEKQLTPAVIARVVNGATPTATCDVTFPFHHHGVGAHVAAYHLLGMHLTGWNLVGFGLYGLLGVILFLWQRGPRRP